MPNDEDRSADAALLIGIVRSSPGTDDLTDLSLRVAAQLGMGRGRVAGLVDRGWLLGSAERDVVGSIQAVYVRGVSPEGLAVATRAVLTTMTQAEANELVTLAKAQTRDLEIARTVSPLLDHLRTAGLVSRAENSVTEFGSAVVEEIGGRTGDVTIVQGVTGSQITIGSSLVSNQMNIHETPIDPAVYLDLIDRIDATLVHVSLNADSLAEIRADLISIRGQVDSPKPKRGVIRACGDNILAVLQGIAGNTAYDGLIELVKKLSG
jgi:hypothetical protein